MSGFSFVKLMIIIKLIKMMQHPILTYGQCFSGQVHHASYSINFFGDSKTLCSSNNVLEENNLPRILYWLFSLTDFNATCWAYVSFKCSSTVAITLSSCTSRLSPTNDKDAELNRQWHWSKQNVASSRNEDRKVNDPKICTVWQ